MGALGAAQTVHCPAFPENDRTVYMGNLFVGDQPLNESPMKDHPLTPMRDSNLARLLAPQVTDGVGLVARPVVAEGAQAIQRELARLKEKGAAHVIADAIDDADLTAIAAACRGMELLCGGSALAAPLPGLLAQDGLIDADAAALPPIPALTPGAIVLSGSCSAATRGQVAAYLGSGAPNLRLSPLDLAERGAAEAVAWLQSQDLAAAPMLHTSAAPEEVAAVQEKLGVERASALGRGRARQAGANRPRHGLRPIRRRRRRDFRRGGAGAGRRAARGRRRDRAGGAMVLQRIGRESGGARAQIGQFWRREFLRRRTRRIALRDPGR